MKITKQLLISLLLLLSACMPGQAESPAEATTAPEATPTVLQTSPKDTTTPTAREQSDEPDESVEFEPSITSTTRSGYLTIEDDWQPSEPPERVDFAHGTNSTRYSGLLPSGLSIKQYVLAADGGQIMTVHIVSEDVPIGLTITSPSGMLLFSESLHADGSSRGGNVHTLVESGDYLIMLNKAEHTPSTNYTVDITIE